MTMTEAPADRAQPVPRRRAPWQRLLFGPIDQPRWARPALWTLLVATAVMYLWGLSALGWANEYYAAAVQAGTQNWTALLFGSLDSSNAITVDKPPAALWLMALSGRLLGFGTLSMLLPQALMAVASVGVLYAAVRRGNGPAAGLLAGGILALTPVAVTMFRDNNPDALLVFLMVLAAYCVVRATERGSGRWLALAGVAIGFGFLTKLLQAFLVLPAFALVFLIAAPIGIWPRLGKLVGAGVAVIVSSGWYLVLGALWPADSRPYIGGSTDNSLWQLALGYNGLGRVFGGDGNGSPAGGSGHGGGGAVPDAATSPGGVGAPGGGSAPTPGGGLPPGGDGPGSGGGSGPGGGHGSAMFGGDTGLTRLFRDTMGTEISWLLPAALIGLVALLWFTRRAPRTGRTRAALILWGGWLVLTGLVFCFMKGTIHPYYTVALAPALAALIGLSVVELWRAREGFAARAVLAGMSAVTGVWCFVLLDRTPDWFPALRWLVLIGGLAAAVALAVGAHRSKRSAAIAALVAVMCGVAGPAAFAIDNVAVADSHTGGMPTSGPKVGGGFGPGSGGPSGGGRGGPGGSSDNPALAQLLEQTDNRWAAASVGSFQVSGIELTTGTAVMAIGGFTGSDDYPTVAQFRDYVAQGQIHYFLGSENRGGHGPPGGRSGVGAEITAWVQQHFAATDVGGTPVYDLTHPLP